MSLDREPTLREWLSDAPFALGMSSGFFGFFAHCGVMTVLEDEGLLPTRVAGSSAGALVTGAWASGIDAQVLAEEILGLERKDFWDPAPGAGLLRGKLFRDRLDRLLAHSELAGGRVPAAVSVYDLKKRRVRVLSSGPTAPAIHASCAVPFMFHPVRHAGGVLVDGGVADRPGLLGLSDSPRVLFHNLISRSPWRGPGSNVFDSPRRDGLTTLIIESLPRVDPFRLPRGRRAFHVARDATKLALDQPIRNREVRISDRPRSDAR